MSCLQLGLELVAHRLVCEEVVPLAGKETADRNLVILVGFDSELAPVMAIRNQRLVQLLDRERKRQVLGVTMPDVADEAMKYSV